MKKTEIYVVKTIYFRRRRDFTKMCAQEIAMAVTREKADVLFELAQQNARKSLAKPKTIRQWAKIWLYEPMVHIDGELLYGIPKFEHRESHIELDEQ